MPRVTAPESSAIVWDENVITADVVNEKLKGTTIADVLHIGKKTILTPTALDELRARGVTWKRISGRMKPDAQLASQTWKMILQHVTPQVQTVIDELKTYDAVGWLHDIAGTVEEGIALAVTSLTRAEVAGVMMFTDRPHAVACLANRNECLRAGVITDFADVDVLKKELDPNVFCLAADGWGGFALRKVVAACTKSKPSTIGNTSHANR